MSNETFLKIAGAFFALVGLAGFFMGEHILFFHVNPLHNIVHLLTGVLCFAFVYWQNGKFAAKFTKAFGIVYLLVALAGFFNVGVVVTALGLNMADNILHAVVAAAFLCFGCCGKCKA